MPKRTNEFQHLILMIEKALAPEGAKIIESKELVDRITGRKREVDVVIERMDGDESRTICVECTGGGENPRPADIGWIEQMWGKHSCLPTDSLILVSKAGYSASAEIKAKAWGFRTLSLSQAEEADWSSVIRELDSIKLVSLLLPHATRVELVFDIGSDDKAPDLTDLDLANSTIYDRDGNEQTTAAALVDRWLGDPNLLNKIEDLVYEGDSTIIEFERTLKPGVYIVDRNGASRPLVAIRIEAKCRKETSAIEVSQGSYGIAAIACGKGQSFGRNLQFLAAQQPQADARIIVSVNKGKSESLSK